MPTRGTSMSVHVAPTRERSASNNAVVSEESGIAAAGGVKAIQQRLAAGNITGGMAGVGAGAGAKSYNTMPSSYRTGTVSAGFTPFNPQQKTAPSHVAGSTYVRQSGVAAGSLASFVGQALGVQHKGEHTGLTRLRNESTEQEARLEHANRGANTAMATLMGSVVKQALEVNEGKAAPESASVAYLAKKLQNTTVVEAVGQGQVESRGSVGNIASKFGGSVSGPKAPAAEAAADEQVTAMEEEVAPVEEEVAPVEEMEEMAPIAEDDEVVEAQKDEEWTMVDNAETTEVHDEEQVIDEPTMSENSEAVAVSEGNNAEPLPSNPKFRKKSTF